MSVFVFEVWYKSDRGVSVGFLHGCGGPGTAGEHGGRGGEVGRLLGQQALRNIAARAS